MSESDEFGDGRSGQAREVGQKRSTNDTSAEQDRRFTDKELQLLKTPPQFNTKVLISLLRPLSLFTRQIILSLVDMRKVNLQVIRPWVTKKKS